MTDRKTNEVEKLRTQVAELTEALKRERADATNARNRHEQELARARHHAKVTVVRQLLGVIDDLERALRHAPKDLADTDYVRGIQGIARQLDKALAGLGVSKIKAAGEPFNPELHEAVSMEDGGGDQEIVSEELQAGYKLGDEVIRHAVVRVKA